MSLRKNDNLIEVGRNIRNWRNIQGIKQSSLADEIGISKVSMCKIETGKTDIPLLRLYSIATALEVKIELLFTDPFLIIKTEESTHLVKQN